MSLTGFWFLDLDGLIGFRRRERELMIPNFFFVFFFLFIFFLCPTALTFRAAVMVGRLFYELRS